MGNLGKIVGSAEHPSLSQIPNQPFSENSVNITGGRLSPAAARGKTSDSEIYSGI